jgi:hypothetical protein
MNRRRFVQGSAFGWASLRAALGAPTTAPERALRADEIEADVVIVGAGLGGCAAALAALRAGKRVVLTEPTDWIGGQLTAQAVPPDEHPWIEQLGANASYRQLRDGIRAYYRAHYPLSNHALEQRFLNPGSGGVSALCHEPRVALAVLTAKLAPFASGGRLTALLDHEPIGCDVAGDRVRSVTVRHSPSGDTRTLIAPYVLDATELGDLLPLAGAEYVTGFESREMTGERHAPGEPQPANHQAFTCCFAMQFIEGGDFTIDRPAEYAFWRDYSPRLEPAWPGRLLSLVTSDPISLEPRTHAFDPTGRGQGLWVYRRIADPVNFAPGAYPGGITLVNWPQNDYLLGSLIDVDRAAARSHIERAKQLSLSLLYWLQTEAPRPDGGTGWKGLRLRPDLVGTRDGLAKAPYIRESRRIAAEFTVLEQHVGTEARRQDAGPDVRAERFADSVGVGSYRIDLHPSTGGDNYLDISSLPFQIPLGALIPKRLENLLPAAKNLGVTHITNGCYRLHPVEWSVGEASGALAAFCIDRGLTPRAVRNTPSPLRDFQSELQARGVELDWPRLGPR